LLREFTSRAIEGPNILHPITEPSFTAGSFCAKEILSKRILLSDVQRVVDININEKEDRISHREAQRTNQIEGEQKWKKPPHGQNRERTNTRE